VCRAGLTFALSLRVGVQVKGDFVTIYGFPCCTGWISAQSMTRLCAGQVGSGTLHPRQHRVVTRPLTMSPGMLWLGHGWHFSGGFCSGRQCAPLQSSPELWGWQVGWFFAKGRWSWKGLFLPKRASLRCRSGRVGLGYQLRPWAKGGSGV
jgi:hypothetical protein